MGGLEADTRLIRAIAAHSGLTPAAIAREIGVAKTTINRPYSGKATARLSGPTLEKLKRHFPEFPGWTTEIEQRLPFGETSGADGSTGQRSGEWIEIPVLLLDELVSQENPITSELAAKSQCFPAAFVRMLTDAPGELLALVSHVGDSMLPTFGDGDVLLIDKRNDVVKTNDLIWALAIRGGISVKRIRLEDDTIILLSDNTHIPEQRVCASECAIIGRVISIIKRT